MVSIGYRGLIRARRGLLRSLPMTSVHTDARRVPPKWLQEVLQDNTEPPRLYAWTPANLHGPSIGTSHVNTAASLEHNNDAERRRIYILGIGNLGRLFATGLAKSTSRSPITLVVHRRDLLERWVADPGIEMTKLGRKERLTDFDIEYWTDQKPAFGPAREPAFGRQISNLLVATKAQDSMTQVDMLRRYLDSASTVAFIQNGMCKLWPPLGSAYVKARFLRNPGPNWIVCVTTHGVTSLGPFRSLHASPADVLVGSVTTSERDASEAGYLLKQLIDAPGLNSRPVSTRELWISQVEKLVVNSTINPLTAILRCKNGELIIERGDSLPRILDRLIHEASEVLRALVLDPSIESILRDDSSESLDVTRAELLRRFSGVRLREMFYTVAAKVAENRSSMLQDVDAGKKTEIREFNGWLVDTANYLDIKSPVSTHKKLITLVEDNVKLERHELDNHF